MSASRPLKSRQRTYRRHCGTPGSGQFRTHAPQQTASSFITEGVDHEQLHSPDRTDAVCPGNGIRFAYRRFGNAVSVPIVFNLQYLGTMDYWDPAVTDGLARGLLVRVRWDLRCAGTSRAGRSPHRRLRVVPNGPHCRVRGAPRDQEGRRGVGPSADRAAPSHRPSLQ
jgi:hypothetical protein